MTLHVPFEQFPHAVQRLLGTKDVYLAPHGYGTLVTAADGSNGILVMCATDHSPATAKTKLHKEGLEVFEGAWRLTDEPPSEPQGSCEAFIAAVAYKSGESTPGVWVDAYSTLPTQVQVLRAMYDEFRETGELPEVSFEEFVRLSEPNVVILSPNDLQSFLDKKPDC